MYLAVTKNGVYPLRIGFETRGKIYEALDTM